MLEESLKTIKNCQLDIELLKRKNELLCKDNNEGIVKLQKSIALEEESLEEELKGSGKDKLECKIGYSSYRKMPDSWIYDDGAIDEIKSIYPESIKRYIKVTETLIKTNIKKSILSKEIDLAGVRSFTQDPKFNYSIKGEH